MKARDLLSEVSTEVRSDNIALAKEIISERVREINSLKVLLKKSEAQLEEILEMDVDDVAML